MILFRDCLRSNRSLAEDYSRLKRDLANRFPTDRPSYQAGKAGFIEEVIKTGRGRVDGRGKKEERRRKKEKNGET